MIHLTQGNSQQIPSNNTTKTASESQLAYSRWHVKVEAWEDGMATN